MGINILSCIILVAPWAIPDSALSDITNNLFLTLCGLSVVLLGSTIANLSSFTSVRSHRIFNTMKKTGHYGILLQNFKWTILYLFLSMSFSLICYFTSEIWVWKLTFSVFGFSLAYLIMTSSRFYKVMSLLKEPVSATVATVATVKSIQQIMRQDSGVDGDAQRISQLSWMFFLKIIDDQDQELEITEKKYRSPIPAELQWRNWAADPEGDTGERLLEFVNNRLFPGLKALSDADNKRRQIVHDVFADANNYMKSGHLMRQIVNKIQTIDFNKQLERQHFGSFYEQLLNDLQSAGNAGEFYTPRALTSFMAAQIDPKPNETMLDPACGTGGFLTCAINHMRDKHIKGDTEEKTMQGNLQAVEVKHLPHMLCVTNMLLHGIKAPSFVRHDDMLARPYEDYGKADQVDVILSNPPFGGATVSDVARNFPEEFQTRETADLFLVLIMRLLKPHGRCGIVLPDGTLFGEGVKTRIKEELLKNCNLHTIVRLPSSVFRPYASISTNLLFFTKGSETENIWYYEHRVPVGQKAYSMTRPITMEHLEPCAKWWNKRRENENAWKVSIKEIRERGYNLDIKNPNRPEMQNNNPQNTLK